MNQKENEIEAVGFTPDLPVRLCWMGQNPTQAIIDHIRELVGQRYPDCNLLRIDCTAPPDFRTDIKSTDGLTGTLHSMIVVLELNLHINKSDQEEVDVAARLSCFADNLDEPASMSVRCRFALEGDKEY